MHIVSYRGPNAGGGVSAALNNLISTEPNLSWWYFQDGKFENSHSGSATVSAHTEIPLDVAEGHYRYCNEFIWPIMHDLPEKATYSSLNHWSYKQFNNLLAAAMTSAGGNTCFIQDYQLATLSSLLDQHFSNRMFFWHIPWPNSVAPLHVPQVAEIAEGLLQAHVVGFHTSEYLSNFRRFVTTHLPKRLPSIANRMPELVVAPLGLDYQSWSAVSFPTQFSGDNLRSLNGNRVVLSVDRIDYTKGVLERIRSINLFFSRYPSYLKKLTFVQVAVKTRTGLSAYDQYWNDCLTMANSVQSMWGDASWQPLVWIDSTIDQKGLCQLYRLANLMLVNPIRDGLNLTAKEFVASQGNHEPGLLLLSRGAGVWNELGDHALELDPHSESQMADAIYQGLEMTSSERLFRCFYMNQAIRANSLKDWWQVFLARSSSCKSEELQYV